MRYLLAIPIALMATPALAAHVDCRTQLGIMAKIYEKQTGRPMSEEWRARDLKRCYDAEAAKKSLAGHQAFAGCIRNLFTNLSASDVEMAATCMQTNDNQDEHPCIPLTSPWDGHRIIQVVECYNDTIYPARR
jgi:hypothetical protein